MMERDPDELRARLARRRRVRFSQPVREWCITVRANDRRIGGRGAAVVPEHAVAVVRAHEVRLEKRGLMWLCRPIEAGFPYTELREFAVEAGTTAGEVTSWFGGGGLGWCVIKVWAESGVRGAGFPGFRGTSW